MNFERAKVLLDGGSEW